MDFESDGHKDRYGHRGGWTLMQMGAGMVDTETDRHSERIAKSDQNLVGAV